MVNIGLVDDALNVDKNIVHALRLAFRFRFVKLFQIVCKWARGARRELIACRCLNEWMNEGIGEYGYDLSWTPIQ